MSLNEDLVHEQQQSSELQKQISWLQMRIKRLEEGEGSSILFAHMMFLVGRLASVFNIDGDNRRLALRGWQLTRALFRLGAVTSGAMQLQCRFCRVP